MGSCVIYDSCQQWNIENKQVNEMCSGFQTMTFISIIEKKKQKSESQTERNNQANKQRRVEGQRVMEVQRGVE